MKKEKTTMIVESGARKRKRKLSNSSPRLVHVKDGDSMDASTVSPLLLAALADDPNSSSRRSLVRHCLMHLRSSLFSQSPPQKHFLSLLLSLLPLLLISKYGDIARLASEALGAASLCSLETNEEIVMDAAVVRALIYALRSSRTKVSMAACNAIMDLSTSSAGRQRLLEFSALQFLISKCLQIHISPSVVSLLCKGNTRSKSSLTLREDQYAVSLIHAVITLVNACKVEQLERFCGKDFQAFSVSLRKLWAEVHNQVLHDTSLKSDRQVSCVNNIGVNGLAQSIFKLSLTRSQLAPLPTAFVERSIFGSGESSFEAFLSSQWETSPLMVRTHSGSLTENDEILGLLSECLGPTESFPTSLCSMLHGFVSCLPIDSDELDIFSFLDDVKNELGCPIVYQQDLRVLRTESQSKAEVHFFNEGSSTCYTKPLHFLSSSDIEKCEEAYRRGYTVALRGMEFRFTCIAAITDAVASLFGQPSVGANLYLTPPNSQGLARHFDDHCVFVCQLFGSKQWTIYPPSLQLPRLYDQLDGRLGSDAACSLDRQRKFLLSEGDIMYIPRGYPHEACTFEAGGAASSNFSLHLTIGIEVEPPFEWEGFLHVALHIWHLRWQQQHHTLTEPLSLSLGDMSVTLLHAVIEVFGASDPTFRKACLAGALALPLDNNDWLYSNQKTAYRSLVTKVSTGPAMVELLKKVEQRENLCERLRWLCHLDAGEETSKELRRGINFTGIPDILAIYSEHKDKAEASFLLVKSRFCSEALFDDAIGGYKMLLEKYKKVRNEYTNGILSLHQK